MELSLSIVEGAYSADSPLPKTSSSRKRRKQRIPVPVRNNLHQDLDIDTSSPTDFSGLNLYEEKSYIDALSSKENIAHGQNLLQDEDVERQRNLTDYITNSENNLSSIHSEGEIEEQVPSPRPFPVVVVKDKGIDDYVLNDHLKVESHEKLIQVPPSSYGALVGKSAAPKKSITAWRCRVCGTVLKRTQWQMDRNFYSEKSKDILHSLEKAIGDEIVEKEGARHGCKSCFDRMVRLRAIEKQIEKLHSDREEIVRYITSTYNNGQTVLDKHAWSKQLRSPTKREKSNCYSAEDRIKIETNVDFNDYVNNSVQCQVSNEIKGNGVNNNHNINHNESSIIFKTSTENGPGTDNLKIGNPQNANGKIFMNSLLPETTKGIYGPATNLLNSIIAKHVDKNASGDDVTRNKPSTNGGINSASGLLQELLLKSKAIPLIGKEHNKISAEEKISPVDKVSKMTSQPYSDIDNSTYSQFSTLRNLLARRTSNSSSEINSNVISCNTHDSTVRELVNSSEINHRDVGTVKPRSSEEINIPKDCNKIAYDPNHIAHLDESSGDSLHHIGDHNGLQADVDASEVITNGNHHGIDRIHTAKDMTSIYLPQATTGISTCVNTGDRDEQGHYVCKICGKSYPSKSGYRYHLKIHTGNRPFECRFCKKTFVEGNILKQHERIHTGDKPYNCSWCDASFAQHSQLRVHERRHTKERPYSCDQCHKSFACNASLKAHKNSHTNSRPYSCNICGKSYLWPNHLRSHMKYHREPAFKCRYCQKKLVSPSELRNHERSHTGERPFTCSLCNKAFTQSCHLKTHLRNTHNNDEQKLSLQCAVCGKKCANFQGTKNHERMCRQKIINSAIKNEDQSDSIINDNGDNDNGSRENAYHSNINVHSQNEDNLSTGSAGDVEMAEDYTVATLSGIGRNYMINSNYDADSCTDKEEGLN